MCSFLLSLTYFFSVSKEAERVMAESVSATYTGGGLGLGYIAKRRDCTNKGQVQYNRLQL